VKLLHAIILPFLTGSVNCDSNDDIHQTCLQAGLHRLQGLAAVTLFPSLLQGFYTFVSLADSGGGEYGHAPPAFHGIRPCPPTAFQSYAVANMVTSSLNQHVKKYLENTKYLSGMVQKYIYNHAIPSTLDTEIQQYMH